MNVTHITELNNYIFKAKVCSESIIFHCINENTGLLLVLKFLFQYNRITEKEYLKIYEEINVKGTNFLSDKEFILYDFFIDKVIFSFTKEQNRIGCSLVITL